MTLEPGSNTAGLWLSPVKPTSTGNAGNARRIKVDLHGTRLAGVGKNSM